MTLFDEHLLSQFDDLLLENKDTAKNANDAIDKNAHISDDSGDDNEDEDMVHKLDANALTLNDLLHEMETRGLQPRGFFEDDSRVLQAEFDKEHEAYVKHKRKEKREAKELEARQAEMNRRRMITDCQMREEREELARDARMMVWIQTIQNNSGSGSHPDNTNNNATQPSQRQGQQHVRIDVNNITARCLARALWNTSSVIISLDVSRMGLNDLAGSYLCRALKNNRSIAKLELGENNFGHRTCMALGDSLQSNQVVKYVSLESNPLIFCERNSSSSCDHTYGTINSIGKMIEHNVSLEFFSLWRCNIGSEGGCILSDAISKNDILTSFEVGYNGFDPSCIKAIFEKLQENKAKRNRNRDLEEKRRQQEEKEMNRKISIAQGKEKEKQVREWMEYQKHTRSEKRCILMEKEKEAKQEEERRLLEEEEHRLLEQKAAELAAKKKKSKKKKGKKKK